MAETKRQGSAMTKERVKRPGKYDVVLHNDDFTTMDFVVHLLRTVFFLPYEKAVEIMMEVHEAGKGIAGTYTRDIAESKATTAKDMARKEKFPLYITIEEHNP